LRKRFIAEIGPGLFRKQAFQEMHLRAKTVCTVVQGKALRPISQCP
jgi:hypothetical protein